MAPPVDVIDSAFDAYLRTAGRKTLLRFVACGSVDDGKSTLLGRLLYESKALFEDQLRTLAADSKTVGTREGALDFALLLDGLMAEREQGITIDVAYRYFSTDRRSFIVADVPGHEQYTRNMVTGASTADLAVVLVDVRKGVITQTRRHSFLTSLLGIGQIVVAINKMDLVGYSAAAFARVEQEYREFAGRIGLDNIVCVPVSAVHGDNVVTRSEAMPWYEGPTLLRHLEEAPAGREAVPPSGPAHQPPQPGFPRPGRLDRDGRRPARRSRAGAAVRSYEPGLHDSHRRP
jgi:bifunctional enzyme CysN/CysC